MKDYIGGVVADIQVVELVAVQTKVFLESGRIGIADVGLVLHPCVLVAIVPSPSLMFIQFLGFVRIPRYFTKTISPICQLSCAEPTNSAKRTVIKLTA